MMFGGNNGAHVFFKQHEWPDDGKIEAKYTSRAADLYRQILFKEVAEADAQDTTTDWVSSYVVKEELPPPKYEVTSDTSNTVTFNKPIGTKRTGSLGARKLITKGSDRVNPEIACRKVCLQVSFITLKSLHRVSWHLMSARSVSAISAAIFLVGS
ncbi:hypothetical protein ISN44_As12g036580 [Arabidopsis suecica]|uniref:Uncharacterized protein n=1 Tax=Arabidopsis suecica TaxID=45249 RepID=A0A8T1YR31_ARASU|nr:hypothetical protein ISN44_As12g036580 [Arabidopsis suecica]